MPFERSCKAIRPWQLAVWFMLMNPCAGLCQSPLLTPQHPEGIDHAVSLTSAQDSLIKDAELFYQQRRFENVVELLSAQVTHGIKHPAIWLRLGNALHQLQRLDEAQAYYRLAAQHPLPDASQLGFLEAARLRSKAWLNVASLNLTLANQALSEFRGYGMPSGDQNQVLQEQTRIADLLRRARLADAPQSDVPQSDARSIRSGDREVSVEYLSGAPARRPNPIRTQ